MKTLQSSIDAPQWDSNLVQDLSFIKKHLRYPFSRKTLVPALMFGVLLAGICRMSLLAFWAVHTRQHIISNTLIVIGLVIGCICIAVFGYMQLLKFTSIHTPFTLAENLKLVQRFLTTQNLAFSQHPEAPEVFQIISRNISPTKKEQREVMIFIADDKRILLNSHFTSRGFAFTPDSRHYKQMANRLYQWIKIHYADTGTAVTSVNVF